MKKLTLIIAGALIVASTSALALTPPQSVARHSNMRIGVVNYDTVFAQSSQGKAKLTALESSLKPKLDAIKKQQTEIKAKMHTFEVNASTMTSSQRKSDQSDLQKQQTSYQQKVLAVRDSITTQEKTILTNFQNAMKTAVATAAHKGHYQMVLSSQAVPYYSNNYDLTSVVLKDMK